MNKILLTCVCSRLRQISVGSNRGCCDIDRRWTWTLSDNQFNKFVHVVQIHANSLCVLLRNLRNILMH